MGRAIWSNMDELYELFCKWIDTITPERVKKYEDHIVNKLFPIHKEKIKG